MRHGELFGEPVRQGVVLRRHLKRDLPAAAERGRQLSEHALVIVDPVQCRVGENQIPTLRGSRSLAAEVLDGADLEPQTGRLRGATCRLPCVALGVVALAIIVSAYPGFVLSSFRPVGVFKGL